MDDWRKDRGKVPAATKATARVDQRNQCPSTLTAIPLLSRFSAARTPARPRSVRVRSPPEARRDQALHNNFGRHALGFACLKSISLATYGNSSRSDRPLIATVLDNRVTATF
jgi:hypothetical protein